MKKRIFIVCLVMALLCTNMTVFASNVNGSGTGDDGPQGTMQISGGPSYRKTGWLLYIVDWHGNQISKTQVIYEYQTPQVNSYYFTTRFNGYINYGDYIIGSPWGYGPFNEDCTANGSKLKSWMLQPKGDSSYNLFSVVEQFFGSAYVTEISKGNMVLIIEPIFWSQVYRDDVGGTGIYLIAPAYGWAESQIKLGVGDYGSKAIGKYTNIIFPNCVKLEYTLYFNGDPKQSGAAVTYH